MGLWSWIAIPTLRSISAKTRPYIRDTLPAESVTLSAAVTGGVTPYRYFWSTGETTESITVSPTETTSYSVLVLDATGCSVENEITVNAIDVSCKNNKVLVCHNNKKTLCIKSSDVADHLAHGDQLGSCDSTSSKSNTEDGDFEDDTDQNTNPTISMNAYPNPFSEQVNFRFEVQETSPTRLEIISMTGQKVATLFKGKAKEGQVYDLELNTYDLPAGMYIYRFKTKNYSKSKIIVLNR